MANGKNGAKMAPGVPVLIGALAVGLVAGFAAGRASAPQSGSQAASSTYQQGFDAARKLVEEAGLVPPEPARLNVLVGQVVEVKSDAFVFKPNSQALNPFLRDLPQTRTVLVAAGTEIIANVPKDPEEYKKEVERYQAIVGKPGEHGTITTSQPLPDAPMAVVAKRLRLADLKPGQTVQVTAKEDIKRSATFTAASVLLSGGAGGNGSPLPAGTPPAVLPPANRDEGTMPPPTEAQEQTDTAHPNTAP